VATADDLFRPLGQESLAPSTSRGRNAGKASEGTDDEDANMSDAIRAESTPQPQGDDRVRILESQEGLPVLCPRCRVDTDSLKDYSVVHFVCLPIYWVWNSERIVACPKCMRKALFQRTAAAVPLANVLFPVVWVVYLSQIFATCRRGHSSAEVAARYRATPSDLVEAELPTVDVRRHPRREQIVLGVLMVPIIGFVIWACFWREANWMRFEGRDLAVWIEESKSPEAVQRAKAVEALSNLAKDSREAVQPLKRIARSDPDPMVRKHAIAALTKIDPQIVQLLLWENLGEQGNR
jgi:hypothetical protein